jgi:alanine racemase
MSTNPTSRAWAEIDASALLHNARTIQSSVGPDTRLLPMVKADAYGLGVAEAVQALEPTDPWGFGVATAEEGAQLRALGVTRPVVVVSPVPEGSLRTALESDVQIGISSLDALRSTEDTAGSLGLRAGIHLEIDTGMGRSGLDCRHVDTWGPVVSQAAEGRVRWVGCYTHLHSANEGPESVHEQWRLLQATLERLKPPDGVVIHMLNSSGAMRLPEYAVAVVRPGIFLYGGEVGAELPVPVPVVTLRARVVHLKEADPGDAVGYGATYRAKGSERWATLSIGYGDGLPRALGNRGHALLRGVRAPIIGRISMDVTVVDITGVPDVGLGDTATLIGIDGDECITLDEVAELAGTISYEVLTGLTLRIPRIWKSLDGS